jgi:hypothetical protein
MQHSVLGLHAAKQMRSESRFPIITAIISSHFSSLCYKKGPYTITVLSVYVHPLLKRLNQLPDSCETWYEYCTIGGRERFHTEKKMHA